MQGLKAKLDDCDFLNFVSDFDIFMFTECWHSKLSNIDIMDTLILVVRDPSLIVKPREIAEV